MPIDENGNWENTGADTLKTQQALNKSLGYGLRPVFLAAGEATVTDEVFFTIVVINEAVLTSITIANSTTPANLTGITLGVGTPICGEISNIVCTSGVVACYR